jgi:hypothetical protein
VAPGQTVKIELGAVGRPVVGKVVVPPGWEDRVVLRSDKLHAWEIGARLAQHIGSDAFVQGMTIPDNWQAMTPRQQHFHRLNWERTPEGIAYRSVQFAEQVHLQPGGAFRFDVLRPGKYMLHVRSFARVPDLSMLEDVADGTLDFTVPALPDNATVTDEPLDLGAVRLKPVPRIAIGTPAPAFEVRTTDGKPLRLEDYRGKLLVLQIHSSNWADSEVEGLKKAYDAFSQDPRFAIVTLHLRAEPADVRKLARDKGLAWPQATVQPLPDDAAPNKTTPGTVPAGYARGPAMIFLIGPDGTVVTKVLRGEAAETAISKALLEMK